MQISYTIILEIDNFIIMSIKLFQIIEINVK